MIDTVFLPKTSQNMHHSVRNEVERWPAALKPAAADERSDSRATCRGTVTLAVDVEPPGPLATFVHAQNQAVATEFEGSRTRKRIYCEFFVLQRRSQARAGPVR
jgi:hypothetical protein